jgi:drug/metabolite transporter (DMT)-like permease
MFALGTKNTIIASLLFAVFLWGGNNAGIKYLVGSWPPIWVGCTRFLCAGLLMLGVLRWTRWLGREAAPTAAERSGLWWRTGLSLAVYIVVFNWSLRFTTASHVALYLGASPVWTLLAEGRPARNWRSAQRYFSAVLAFSGVLLLFWPTLQQSNTQTHWTGELLGLFASLLWAYHGLQCRLLGATLSGVSLTAQTMWRAGVWLIPLALIEIALHPPVWGAKLVLVQGYCILFGGVAAFALWNNALSRWPTSQVFLFNNLIPLSTMSWAHWCLGEQVTRTYFLAMALIVGAVVFSRLNLGRWRRVAKQP